MVAELLPELQPDTQEDPEETEAFLGSMIDGVPGIGRTRGTYVLPHPYNPELRLIEKVGNNGQVIYASECTPSQLKEFFSNF